MSIKLIESRELLKGAVPTGLFMIREAGEVREQIGWALPGRRITFDMAEANRIADKLNELTGGKAL